MSITSVLIPVRESEIADLFHGGERRAKARDDIVRRALVLRPRVALVDAVREDLHSILYPLFEQSTGRPPNWFDRLKMWFSANPTAIPSSGYDPFVQLFGRSLPVSGRSPEEVAFQLHGMLDRGDEDFRKALRHDLAQFSPAAAECFEKAPDVDISSDEIAGAVDEQVTIIGRALDMPTPSLREALDAAIRLSAWSWPVWRLDGEMLPDLLIKLNTSTKAERASGLFGSLAEERPEVKEQLDQLPKRISGFEGAGSCLPSAHTGLLARTLTLQVKRTANRLARSGESPTVLMRHVRLFEEALRFCEMSGLGLCEASGVEWHDRR